MYLRHVCKWLTLSIRRWAGVNPSDPILLSQGKSVLLPGVRLKARQVTAVDTLPPRIGYLTLPTDDTYYIFQVIRAIAVDRVKRI